MTDALSVHETQHGGYGGYRISWFVDGDVGATLGEQEFTAKQVEKSKDTDEWEYRLCNYVASKTQGVSQDANGYMWETQREAKAALKVIRAALKDGRSRRPWPDWAIKAKAAGWTPPNGWTP